MSYTLAMASDLEPRIAEDGVQEVPLTKARALLTRVIEQAREDGLLSALTVRGRRRAYVVTPDFYEQALRDRETLRYLRQRATETLSEDAKPEVKRKRQAFADALDAAELHAKAQGFAT